jgi:predicted deacylase
LSVPFFYAQLAAEDAMLSEDPWPNLRRCLVTPPDPFALSPDIVARTLEQLRGRAPDALHVAEVGRSAAGRPISLATLGSGPVHVLLWSQMHGDEPTHTAVLLNLVQVLVRQPPLPEAGGILQQCTLHLVVGLNPDGMAAVTRVNAQHIDVNRDARRLQTPEGVLLRRLVEELRPQFAFNLHNQNARTAVGFPPRQATVSLLAPPLDAADTQTPSVRRAKQVAVRLLEAVEPFCEGGVSRYDADYMPRAFGEWVQGQGTSAVLVEAGGWTDARGAEAEAQQLVLLHLHGLLAALRAIGDGSFAQADPARYDALPRSSEHALFDVLIRRAQVCSGALAASFLADVGILCGEGRRVRGVPLADGLIDDLGDLDVTTGKEVIDADGLRCWAGGWCWEPEVGPGAPPAADRWEPWLSAGVTTLVGRVDLADEASLAALEQGAAGGWSGPGNVAFVASWRRAGDFATQRRALLRAIAAGVLAAEGLPADAELVELCTAWRLPRWEEAAGNGAPPVPGQRWTEPLAIAALTRRLPVATPRGAVLRGDAADLQLAPGDGADHARLRCVLTAGRVVWRNDAWTGESPGRWLLSRMGAAVHGPPR